MFRVVLQSVCLVFVLLGSVPRSLGAESFELPPLRHCPAPKIALNLQPAEDARWTECEKWVWSCIVQGKEANLYEKKCTKARPDGDDIRYRWRYKFAPFFDPDRYKNTNALSSRFIRDLLWLPQYSQHIPPVGIRIFGGYFARSLNLENITTNVNLVIDGSIFRRGVRMTNFATTKNVSFDRSNIRSSMLLMRARIDGSLFIKFGVFDRVDLRDSRIGASLEASGSLFNDNFQFDRAHIDGKAHFVYSRLTALNGRDAKIGGTIELRLVDIRVSIDLSGTRVNGDVRLQNMTFGRQIKSGRPRCDWDTDIPVNNILQNTNDVAKGMPDGFVTRLLDEIVYHRPVRHGQRSWTMCDEHNVSKDFKAPRQVMLRDMRISGTLCVMDTAGRFPIISRDPNGGNVETLDFGSIETISFDGTQANTTVIRWTDVDSHEIWRAVNFKTGYMLLGLRPHPQRHFFDNWKIAQVAFLRPSMSQPGSTGPAASQTRAGSSRGLCEVTSGFGTLAEPQHRKTQKAIAEFFSNPTNQSGSYQPLANIVQSLENSDVETTYLKIELSKYKNQNRCATSLFSKMQTLPWQQSANSLQQTPVKLMAAWREGLSVFNWINIEEIRKLGLDTVCTIWQPVSFYTTSYGHESTNLIYIFFLFVLVFGVLLSVFDRKASTQTSSQPKLGFLYSLDMFLPTAQLRINNAHQNLRPHRLWLRWWLFFHRLAGAIICLAIFVLVFKAV